MVDILQLKEGGQPKYLKTHADAVDGLKEATVSKVGNETVLGTKDFRDGLLLSGRRVLSADGTPAVTFNNKTHPQFFADSGGITFTRMGDVVYVKFNFKVAADIARNVTVASIDAKYRPADNEPILCVGDKFYTVQANGEVKCSWGAEKDTYHIGSGSYIAKDKL